MISINKLVIFYKMWLISVHYRPFREASLLNTKPIKPFNCLLLQIHRNGGSPWESQGPSHRRHHQITDERGGDGEGEEAIQKQKGQWHFPTDQTPPPPPTLQRADSKNRIIKREKRCHVLRLWIKRATPSLQCKWAPLSESNGLLSSPFEVSQDCSGTAPWVNARKPTAWGRLQVFNSFTYRVGFSL